MFFTPFITTSLLVRSKASSKLIAFDRRIISAALLMLFLPANQNIPEMNKLKSRIIQKKKIEIQFIVPVSASNSQFVSHIFTQVKSIGMEVKNVFRSTQPFEQYTIGSDAKKFVLTKNSNVQRNCDNVPNRDSHTRSQPSIKLISVELWRSFMSVF